MATNNLRVIYQNQADYTASVLTVSSTASVSTPGSNLLKDTRSLVWRTGTRTTTNFPVIFKSAATAAASGKHSGFTVTSTNTATGSAPTHCTVTALGGTEATTAVALPYYFVPPDTNTAVSYTVRIYSSSTKTVLLDTQVIPVILTQANAINVVCSNNNHVFPDTAGTVTDYTNTGCNIWVFEGCTPLYYNGVGTSTNTFTVSAASTTGPIAPSTPNAATTTINCAVYPNHTTGGALLATNVITYTITYKTRGGSTGSLTTTQTFTKSAVSWTPNIVTSFASTTAHSILLLTLPATNTAVVGGAVLTLTNAGTGAAVRLSGYNTNAPTLSGSTDLPRVVTTAGQVPAFDTKNIEGISWDTAGVDNWTTLGTTTFGADRNCIRAFVPSASQVLARYIVVEVMDLVNSSGYIEASRLIVGPYWTPIYNTSYGMSSSIKDTSTNERTESGDLITTNGVVYKTLNFDMNWMTKADKDEMIKLLKIAGSRRGIFVSLFPDNSDDYGKENLYQIYGKLLPNSGITHPYLDTFATQIEVEEV